MMMNRIRVTPAILAALLALLFVSPQSWGQTDSGQSTSPQQKPGDNTDSGGPDTDNGPIVLKKKKDADEPPPPAAPAEPKVKNPNN